MNKIKKIFLLSIIGFAAGCMIYLLWLPWVPSLQKENPKTSSLVQRRTDQARQKRKKHEPKMMWRNLSQISPNLVHAVLIAEDDTFYQHHGLDFDQIQIAVKINWKKKRFAYGGSTLTQQLARTLYLSPKKSLFRKAKEALIALWMERTLSKKRILELYLNAVEWGDGVYGAQAAAEYYYQKDAGDLTPEEAVAMASVLPSPRKWSPHRVTPFMTRRRSNILDRMEKAGYLSAEEKEDEWSDIMQEIPEDNGADEETEPDAPARD